MPDTRVVQYVTDFEGLEPSTTDDFKQFITNLAGASGSYFIGDPLESEYYTMISFRLVDGRKAIDLLN